MEGIKKPENNLETKKEKVFLYHMVPEDMHGNILHPLNVLKDARPDLFTKESKKYTGREHIMDYFIHSLECNWNDVIHLSPVKPEDIKQALLDAGFDPLERKFYQIDPDLLDPSKTTIYLYQNDTPAKPTDFTNYDPKNIDIHSVIPERTLAHYKEAKEAGKHMPLLFVGVPHILHKGSIDTSKFHIVTV